ncbi:MAG: exodeoxyribonuclease V subunit beta [Balneolaceae bacterium]|nr:MAG: exodeoxyribonuclease V subunit beta [Balneolaceae bacterium]
MKMRVLESLFDLTFEPRQFIEANAGTGKTYTIAGLFVRLMLEKNLRVDQILVMTFTKKATAELRDRIFLKLKETLLILEGGQPEDQEWMRTLLRHTDGQERGRLAAQIAGAVRNFDESQIYTIHGFCQKILREEALMAGTPFDLEVTQTDDLLLQAAGDEWRLFMASHPKDEAGRYRLRKLLDIAGSPAELVKLMQPLFSRPYAKIRGEGHPEPEAYLAKVIRKRKEMVSLWREQRGEITDQLLNSDLKGYTENSFVKWVVELEEAFSADFYVPVTFTNFKRFLSSYHRDPDNLKKNGTRFPQHPFFELCEEYQTLLQEMGTVETGLIIHFYRTISERRRVLAEGSSVATYDDLLNRVSNALADPEYGEALATLIRKKLPFALVDEFQDTDPVQYRIFERIYPEDSRVMSTSGREEPVASPPSEASDAEHGLLMIGDPKQAIYAFRGADIYTYLRARNQCSAEGWSLQKNFRSSPELIEAVNHLFEGEHVPFLEPDITFTDSKSGREDLSGAFLIDGEPAKPMQISVIEGFYNSQQKSEAFALSVRQIVRQIVRLLSLAEKGRATIQGKRLRAADLCVLVNSHRDAAAVKRALRKAGVGAVTYSREKVFESGEAERLLQVLLAILDPQDYRQVCAALLTGFFSRSLSRIDHIRHEEAVFQQFLEELAQLNDLWHRSGFYPMFRKLLYTEQRLAVLAGQDGSERMLTNLLQLAGICSKAEASGGLSPRSLTEWFRRQMNDPDDDEERTLLLESDLNLVKISTIHSSKGLQFPVVFLPSPWAGLSQSGKKDIFSIYSDRETDQTIIHVGQDQGAETEWAVQQARFEALADEVRKFYVAVTRARFQCHLCWAAQGYSHHSGIGAALLGREQILKLINENKTLLKKEDLAILALLNGSVRSLEAKHPGGIGLLFHSDGEEGDEQPEEEVLQPAAAKPLTLRRYGGRDQLPLRTTLESFSSLVHHQDPGAPDHDQLVQEYTTRLERDPEEPVVRNIFTFPRGAAAGSAIHMLFEHESFDFRTAGKAADEVWIGDVLEQYRIGRDWAPVARQMMADVAGAEIPQISLGRIAKEDQLREMEFHFASRRVRSRELMDQIRGGTPAQKGSGAKDQAIMTGFIDLIVRQNGKYYIIDYKSNHLGDSETDYSAPALEVEMERAGYDLQAHLYLVALTGFLEKRLPDFRYETHIGGMLYLFVRGMKKGSGNGVWFRRPEAERVTELKDLLVR